MTNLLNNIETICTNKKHTPIEKGMLEAASEIVEYKPIPLAMEYIVRVQVGARCIARDEKELEIKREEMRRHIAHEVYGDCIDDLHKALIDLHEKHYLPYEDMQPFYNLLEKMKGG